MASSTNRLNREQVTALLSHKDLRVTYNPLGTLKYIPSGSALAVVTSAKHEKRATARNKLRRRLKALFGQTEAPLIGILYASKQSYALPYEKIKTLFHELVEKSKNRSR